MHFVIPELDAGPIVIQAAVPVLANDTAESLSKRVLRQEHLVYPRAIQVIVECTPLYQGVVLLRGLTLGVVGPDQHRRDRRPGVARQARQREPLAVVDAEADAVAVEGAAAEALEEVPLDQHEALRDEARAAITRREESDTVTVQRE